MNTASDPQISQQPLDLKPPLLGLGVGTDQASNPSLHFHPPYSSKRLRRPGPMSRTSFFRQNNSTQISIEFKFSKINFLVGHREHGTQKETVGTIMDKGPALLSIFTFSLFHFSTPVRRLSGQMAHNMRTNDIPFNRRLNTYPIDISRLTCHFFAMFNVQLFFRINIAISSVFLHFLQKQVLTIAQPLHKWQDFLLMVAGAVVHDQIGD